MSEGESQFGEHIPGAEFHPDFEQGEEDDGIREALDKAGLSGVESPRAETPAYERLKQAALNYIAAVDTGQYEGKKKADSSNRLRRQYHNELCLMLLGKSHQDLTPDQRDQISDFAAHLAGADEYVGTW